MGKFLSTWILITTYGNDSALSSGSLLPLQRQEAHLWRESNRGCVTLWSVLTMFSSFCMQDIPQYRIFFFEIQTDNQLPLAVLLIVFDCLDKHHGRRKWKWQTWQEEETTVCSLLKTNQISCHDIWTSTQEWESDQAWRSVSSSITDGST